MTEDIIGPLAVFAAGIIVSLLSYLGGESWN